MLIFTFASTNFYARDLNIFCETMVFCKSISNSPMSPLVQANILKCHPNKRDLTEDTEVVHAREKLLSLYDTLLDDPSLRQFVTLARSCLELEFRTRLTAKELLDRKSSWAL